MGSQNRYEYHSVAVLASLLAVGILCVSWPTVASTMAKQVDRQAAYRPFDEPRPKDPPELLTDTRLNTRIRVSAKSSTLKDLLVRVSAETKVKLSTARDVSEERAFIFFHDRPLRDLMTELSDLYGYYWLAKGKPGEWSYELFEDIRHAQRRDQLRQERRDRAELLMADSTDAAGRVLDTWNNHERRKHLQESDPELFSKMHNLYAGYAPQLAAVSMLDDSLLRTLMSGQTLSLPIADLSEEQKLLLLRALNSVRSFWTTATPPPGQTFPQVPQLRLEDLDLAALQFGRYSRSLFDIGRITMRLTIPGHEVGNGQPELDACWPPGDLSKDCTEADLLSYASADSLSNPESEDKAGIVIGDLAKVGDKEVSIPPERSLFFVDRVIKALMMGDVLEAIADQTGLDVVADYYFQPDFLVQSAGSKKKLDRLLPQMCQHTNYTCQVQQSILRFRFNNWFLRPLPDEPPHDLIERCWTQIGQNGKVELETLLDLANLPDRQVSWAGLRFVPYASRVQSSLSTLRLWKALGPLEAEAEGFDGLQVTRLSPGQQEMLYSWIRAMKISASFGDLAQAVVFTIRTSDPLSYQLSLVLPSGDRYSSSLTLPRPLDEKQRTSLMDQRQADMVADKVEVLN